MKRVPTQIAVGTERQRRGEAATVEDAAGRDDRARGRPTASTIWGTSGKRRDLSGVTARLGALGHHQVASRLDGAHGVLDLAAHADDDHVVAVAQVDDLGRDARARRRRPRRRPR